MGHPLDFDYIETGLDEDNTLLGVLNRLLDAGVVISGDVKVSVANVDLLEIGLKLMLASTDTAERWRSGERLPKDETAMRRVSS